MLGGKGIVFFLNGGQTFIIFLFHYIQLVLCGKRLNGICPDDIFVVGTRYQPRIVRFAGNAYEGLVTFVYFGVILLLLVLLYQLLEGRISL